VSEARYRLRKLRLSRVSLVAEPAAPGARVSFFKSATPVELSRRNEEVDTVAKWFAVPASRLTEAAQEQHFTKSASGRELYAQYTRSVSGDKRLQFHEIGAAFDSALENVVSLLRKDGATPAAAADLAYQIVPGAYRERRLALNNRATGAEYREEIAKRVASVARVADQIADTAASIIRKSAGGLGAEQALRAAVADAAPWEF
jgi:hypothetical protein